jgi:hypothetical protein
LSVETQQSLGSVNIGSPFFQEIHHEHVEPLYILLEAISDRMVGSFVGNGIYVLCER